MLFKVSQEGNGMLYVKWIVLFGDEQATKVITGMCPKVVEDKFSAVLEAVVLAVQEIQ